MKVISGEKVLLFNFRDGEQLKAVQMALFLMQVPGRIVSKEEYGVPLKLLAGDEKLPITVGGGTQELDGQMVVFAGLGEEKLESLLSLLRSNPACGKIPYKAILTPTNQNWSALTLFQELQKEHAMMKSAAERQE